MPVKKVKKDFWDNLFDYPSFNKRFFFVLIFVLLVFCILAYFVCIKLQVIQSVSDQVAMINLFVQSATLVLGIFAAYYALRQLVETRFISLDEAGTQEIKRFHYLKAFEKWREAFNIRPESGIFTNMCESLLLIGDYNTFDQYVKKIQGTRFFEKEIFQESSDKIVIIYLKIVRHLLVENLGEAKKYILELITLVKQDGLFGLNWDYSDLRTSTVFQDLNTDGEAKKIIENLILYLSKNIPASRKKDFESGNYASQLVD